MWTLRSLAVDNSIGFDVLASCEYFSDIAIICIILLIRSTYWTAALSVMKLPSPPIYLSARFTFPRFLIRPTVVDPLINSYPSSIVFKPQLLFHIKSKNTVPTEICGSLWLYTVLPQHFADQVIYTPLSRLAYTINESWVTSLTSISTCRSPSVNNGYSGKSLYLTQTDYLFSFALHSIAILINSFK